VLVLDDRLKSTLNSFHDMGNAGKEATFLSRGSEGKEGTCLLTRLLLCFFADDKLLRIS